MCACVCVCVYLRLYVVCVFVCVCVGGGGGGAGTAFKTGHPTRITYVALKCWIRNDDVDALFSLSACKRLC